MEARNRLAHWQLEPLPKYSSRGVTRAVEPRKTIRRAREVIRHAGVTRIAEVTQLDRIGIPNYMSVRPLDAGPGISYYNGKGTTKADAHAGALMEAVERHAGESCSYRVLVGSRAELGLRHECIDPAEIIVPRVRDYHDDLVLEWVAGFDLLQNRETWVPLNCVTCPYQATAGVPVFYASTNGLASGNSLAEAVCHALCEIVERDALAITSARTLIAPAVRELLDKAAAADRTPKRIRLDGLPRRAARLVGLMRAAGLKIFLRDLTSTAGVATIDCSIAEPGFDGVPNVHGGCGTHPDARVALLRALTEAAQSRVACIQGGREDLPEVVKPKQPYDPEDIYGVGDWIRFDQIPSVENQRIDQDVRLLLDRLPACGIDQLIAFDLTHPEVGIPVVRIVAPRAEAWTVFHLHTGRGAFGARVASEL